MNYTTRNHRRNHHNPSENPVFPSKRVEIVKIKLVRESSFLYGKRRVNCPIDAYELGKVFMEEIDREQLIVCCLDTKNQPLNVHVVSMGSLNASIIHQETQLLLQKISVLQEESMIAESLWGLIY